jgi:hypothetical protein
LTWSQEPTLTNGSIVRIAPLLEPEALQRRPATDPLPHLFLVTLCFTLNRP